MTGDWSGLTAASTQVLAANNFGDTRGGALAGPLGLFLLVLLLIATALLVKNMNTRIKRLPARFPGQDDPADPDDEQPGSGPAAAPGDVAGPPVDEQRRPSSR